MTDPRSDTSPRTEQHHGFTNAVVRVFLHSHLALILILLSAALGVVALWVTPREEDPQIVVPLADVYVNFPGHSAAEVEQLVATPLEKLLNQIDGVEYVYSMSREGMAVITVRYYVGEDRERSLVKLYKRIDEHLDTVPPGVTGWLVKPVEIDDVPIVTLALAGRSAGADAPPTRSAGTSVDRVDPHPPITPDEYTLRRVAEEVVERLAAVHNVSRAYVIGGQPRVAHVYLDPQRMAAHNVSPLEIQRALQGANVEQAAGGFTRNDESIRVDAGRAFVRCDEMKELVVGVSAGRPVFLKDVAQIVDGPAEPTSYVRHGWGPARGFEAPAGFTGTRIGERGASSAAASARSSSEAARPAVTIALAKKKGTNAVWVARDCLAAAEALKRDVIPDNMDLIVTRNAGFTADEKVNELVEALAVAVLIIIALLTLGLGWREALIVAVAVPVVFGLTLLVNLLCGYTINRVTLFALILSLGLLVDDPIVDVENIARHFALRGKATREIVLEAVAEIRPPLITATLAVIVSFLPMFFITGMMGPYMRPMALNVPVTMLMSMLVAFTITPWMAYHVLGRRRGNANGKSAAHAASIDETQDLETLRKTLLWRFFHPLMAPLLRSRRAAWTFLAIIGLLTAAAAGLAAIRAVPLKMLPFDNKNELLLVLDFDEGTTLERSDAAVRELERYVAAVPEVSDFTSYVGAASPMDFNGLVRHYYLRQGDNVAEFRLNLAGKKNRSAQSHALGLRMRDDLTAIARRCGANLKMVETPPGPPVIATLVAEVSGRSDQPYEELIAAAKTVRARLEREPGVVDVDDTVEADSRKLIFTADREKAALSGVSVAEIADTIRIGSAGAKVGAVREPHQRNALAIELRLPRALRSSAADLAQMRVKGGDGKLVPLAELGRWQDAQVDKTIYHKNLERVVYVFAETAGRPPADCVVDVQHDREVGEDRTVSTDKSPGTNAERVGSGWISNQSPRPVQHRTFLQNGGQVAWQIPDGSRIDFAGEGEWKITLDVFRDLGLAFAAALVGIYILLVAQTGSFAVPVIVMLAIPLTVLGVMPGFWLLNAVSGGHVGAYADPVFFTATGMIGMIALSGIVTRDAIILVDFIHISLARGRSLLDAIMESRIVRLRPILLTAGAAMLGAAPITIDPIFSGLAWSLIFGLFASTLFTLFVIPVSYWLLHARRSDNALPA